MKPWSNKFPKLKTIKIYDPKITPKKFSEISETFLDTPPPFILRGPIYLIFIIIITGVLYSFFATVSVNVTGYLTVKGEEYLVQAPISGIVDAVYVNNNDKIRINQKLFSVSSQQAFSQEKNLKVAENQRVEVVNKIASLLSFEKEREKLLRKYQQKSQSFSFTIPQSTILKQSEIYGLDLSELKNSSNLGVFNTDYLNLKHNLQIIWKEYLATFELFKQKSKTFKEDTELYEKKLIARQDYLFSKENLSNVENQLESLRKNFKTVIVNSVQKSSEVKELLKAKLENSNREIETINNAMLGYEVNGNTIGIRSRYSGEVAELFFKPAQFLVQGNVLAKIIRDDFPLHGVIYIGSESISKLAEGQQVYIKYEAFPYQQYGVQKGEVIEIASDVKEIPGRGMVYEIIVALKNNPKIKLKSGNLGIAEINTGKKRIIELVFAPIGKLFSYLDGE